MLRALASCLCILLLASCAKSEPRGPIIMAASSLQQPLEQLAENWAQKGFAPPVFSFASSAALARQIESGNPADIFISADSQWTDYLISAGKVGADGAKTIAANNIGFAWHFEDGERPVLTAPPNIEELLNKGPVATGDPNAVPLGRFAREALISAGLWEKVAPELVSAASARAALVLVDRGEAKVGILYASDAANADNVAMVRPFTPDSHSPILYVAVHLPSSGHPDTQALLEFLASDEAAVTFDNFGFPRP